MLTTQYTHIINLEDLKFITKPREVGELYSYNFLHLVFWAVLVTPAHHPSSSPPPPASNTAGSQAKTLQKIILLVNPIHTCIPSRSWICSLPMSASPVARITGLYLHILIPFNAFCSEKGPHSVDLEQSFCFSLLSAGTADMLYHTQLSSLH